MSASVPAKSILKQPARKAPIATDGQKSQVEEDRKNLKIALKHAYLIQHQKDIEAAILKSVVDLIDLPATSKHTSREAVAFVNLVSAFQPSDYDGLIEERAANGRCAYVLCANPPRSQTLGKSAVWRLDRGMPDWCSDNCAKKGLYIKTQLSEVPAWERDPKYPIEIQLHEDDRPAEDESALRRASRIARVDEWRQRVANNDELARERGEKPSSLRPNQVMSDRIVEKHPALLAAPTEAVSGGDHTSIEGYQPRRVGNARDSKHHDDDDDDDNDDNDDAQSDGD